MHASHGSGVEPHRFSRADYERMIEPGILDEDDPVELIDGEILTMAPQYSLHSATVMHVRKVLDAAFGADYHVRVQMPLALDPMSEPEPDLAVVPGRELDYLGEHPKTAALVVEVAQSTLSFARRWKGSLYARAGIADYWVVNLADRRLEVHREPTRDETARYGFAYATVQPLRPGDVVAPVARPGFPIDVADLLP